MIRAAVFSHNGLGDGINTLVLSHNLLLHGWRVDTYHNSLGTMQNWFPHLPLLPYPAISDIPSLLDSYDFFFVVQNTTSEFVKALIREGKKRFSERVKVLYLYPSKNIINEPYYADCQIKPFIPVAENLRLFCEKILGLSNCVLSNGVTPPKELVFRKHPRRIVIHPTSGKEGRSWPKEKYVKLALHLQSCRYELVFIPGGEKEKREWSDIEFNIPLFPTLDALAGYLYESGYLIGNDSGLGHLASNLGIRTLSFFRKKTASKMWRPSFSPGIVLFPSDWIPNISGFRLRDRHWKSWITVGKALRGAKTLLSTKSLG